MLDSFYSTVDDKKLTTLISLDISAAFDTISHDTLLTQQEPLFQRVCSSRMEQSSARNLIM